MVEPKGHCFSGGAVRWPDLQLTQLGLLVSTLSGMLFGVLREAGLSPGPLGASGGVARNPPPFRPPPECQQLHKPHQKRKVKHEECSAGMTKRGIQPLAPAFIF